MDVLLTDPKSTKEEKGNVEPAEYTVYPDKVPCKNYSKIMISNEMNFHVFVIFFIVLKIFI